MENKVKSISEFLTEEDVLTLTEEAFTSHKVIKFEFKKVKPLLTIAASLILMVGVLNIDSISAKTGEFFSYVFGVGVSKSSDLNDYYVLEESVQLNDKVQIEGAYRKGNQLTMILRGPLLGRDVKLRIGNKLYEPSIGESVATNSTTSSTEAPSEQIEQTEITFNNIKASNDLTLVLGEQEVTFSLKQSAVIESDAFIQVPVGDSVLQLLPLSTDNTKFVIAYETPSFGKVSWAPKTLGLFSDHTGEQSYSTTNVMSPYEILVAQQLPGTIERFDGTGISLTKYFNGLFNTPEIKLPNPASGETLIVDQEFDIDGVTVTVHSISREGEEVTILFNRETSYKPLNLLWLESKDHPGSGGGGGGGDAQTVDMILSRVPSNSKMLTFEVEELRVIIEEPFEIIFK